MRLKIIKNWLKTKALFVLKKNKGALTLSCKNLGKNLNVMKYEQGKKNSTFFNCNTKVLQNIKQKKQWGLQMIHIRFFSSEEIDSTHSYLISKKDFFKINTLTAEIQEEIFPLNNKQDNLTLNFPESNPNIFEGNKIDLILLTEKILNKKIKIINKKTNKFYRIISQKK